ncbi:MAG: FAD binding domain-containing protein [Bacteroidetes bacterium]|nr:FAD binding domain-containing protein [Bacteroidota bacterium]
MLKQEKYIRTTSVQEAIEIGLAHISSFRYLAGGTDVVVNKFQGNETAPCLIHLTGIKELKEINVTGDSIRIGSLVRLDELADTSEIVAHFPALITAAKSVASPVIRKTATLGGNLLCENRCVFYNQSEWWRKAVGFCLKCDGDICIATGGKKNCFSKIVSDTAPVLIALNAHIEIAEKDGIKMVPLQQLYTGNGINPREISNHSIITSIHLKLKQNINCVFKKLRPREAVDFTSLTTAVSIDDKEKIRIVLGGVDPGPVLIEAALPMNSEEIIKVAVKKCRIVDNDYYTRGYRKEMIRVFLQRSFKELNIN